MLFGNVDRHRKNVVIQAPLPKLDSKIEEGYRVCTSLFVDVVECCRIVHGHLDCGTRNEYFESAECFKDRQQLEVVDVESLFVRGPCGMNLKVLTMCTPTDGAGIGCNLNCQLERCKRSPKEKIGWGDPPNQLICKLRSDL